MNTKFKVWFEVIIGEKVVDVIKASNLIEAYHEAEAKWGKAIEKKREKPIMVVQTLRAKKPGYAPFMRLAIPTVVEVQEFGTKAHGETRAARYNTWPFGPFIAQSEE